MSKRIETLPDWELVLSAAARLQHILPEAVLVGGTTSALHAEHRFSRDAGHRQDTGESPLQQLQVQLGDPLPYDLESTELSEYKNLDPRWHDWDKVKAACTRLATVIFDRVCEIEAGRRNRSAGDER